MTQTTFSTALLHLSVCLSVCLSVVDQIAWALNKGVKQEYKQFWDVDLGVTYIPWEKVKLDDLDDFAEGGIIDQETVDDGERKLHTSPPGSMEAAETLAWPWSITLLCKYLTVNTHGATGWHSMVSEWICCPLSESFS